MSARRVTAQEPRDEPDDLALVLDEELARLPETYRAVILACDVEGRTRKDAAARLGIPDGTLSNRLASARRMLARRLTRRGIAPGAAGIAALLPQASAAARVPPALVGATVRLASGDAAVPAAPTVSALADGEMKMILFTKLNAALVGVVVLVAGVAFVGAKPPAAIENRPPSPVPLALVAVSEPRLPAKPAAPPATKVIDNDGPIDDVALSPDGKFAVAQTRVLDEDRSKTVSPVKLWNVKTGQLVRTLYEGKNAHGIAFSPDGKHVATAITKFDRAKVKPGDIRDAFSSEVLVWDVATGRMAATLTDSTAHTLYHIAYSRDGKYIAAGGGLFDPSSAPAGGEVTVWDATSMKVLWSNQEHKNAVRRLMFSADGKQLATPSDDGTIRLWDSFTGKHQKTIDSKAEHGIFSAAFSADGKLIAGAVSSDGTVRVWNAETGELKHTFEGYKPGSMTVVSFLTDGTLVTAGTAEKGDGNLKLWDVKTGRPLKAIADPNLTMRSMDVSADGKTVVVGTWEKSLVIVPLGD